jgi:hypothetical protein
MVGDGASATGDKSSPNVPIAWRMSSVGLEALVNRRQFCHGIKKWLFKYNQLKTPCLEAGRWTWLCRD